MKVGDKPMPSLRFPLSLRLGRCLSVIFAFCIVGINAESARADHDAHSFAAASPSVVIVNPTWPGHSKPGFGAPPGTAPAGSGVLFSPSGETLTDYILTAAHVIAKATRIEVIGHDGSHGEAILHGLDAQRDIAVLKWQRRGKAIVMMPETPMPGSHVCALGNPFGLGISISCGVVSAVGRSGIGFNAIEDFIQTDAAVNPGSSGGALINGDGQLVGIISGIFTKNADIDAGVNFAVSTRLVEQSLAAMRNRGIKF